MFAPPPIKFKDLESVHQRAQDCSSGPIFPFDVRTDFVKVTDEHGPGADHHPDQEPRHHIRDQGRRCERRGQHPWQGHDDDCTRRCRPLRTRSRSSSRPNCWRRALDRKSIYWKAVPLLPGLYRLDIAIKDVNNPDHVGIYGRGLNVPAYHDEKLGHFVPDLGGSDVSGQFARYRRRATASSGTPMSARG